MINFLKLLEEVTAAGGSDVFVVSGQPLSYKKANKIICIDDEKVMPDTARSMVESIYGIANRDIDILTESGDDDFAISVSGMARFRISTYKQRGSFAAVIRVISFGIPDYQKMNIPDNVMEAASIQKGMALVTGLSGSGKSTTLACIIDRINKTRSGHIITLEEPIEFLYRNEQCIISQREVELDTRDYVTALRACLRQAPDVILVGEMRDLDTIKTALTAAETGHLLFSTLHTMGAANAIDRIIDIFPPNQQQQVRVQLAMLLRTVISQQLIPAVDGSLVPVFEVMFVNNAIRNMIREAKVHQIDSVIGVSAGEGMISMDNSLLNLAQKGVITRDTALRYAIMPDALAKRMH